MQDKKFRDQRTMSWPDDGHRLNLYINAYLNVGVRPDKFQDYIAAGLEQLAAELRAQAAAARGRYLLEHIVSEEVDPTMTLEETKEVAKEVKHEEKKL